MSIKNTKLHAQVFLMPTSNQNQALVLPKGSIVCEQLQKAKANIYD